MRGPRVAWSVEYWTHRPENPRSSLIYPQQSFDSPTQGYKNIKNKIYFVSSLFTTKIFFV